MGAATFVGYAVGVDKALAQAIKTDTDGLVAGDQTVAIGSYNMPVYEARPATGTGHPIVIVVSEVWGVHEWVKDVTRRFAKAGYHGVAPELFQREGGVGHIPNVQDIVKIVLAVPRKQVLGDVAAAIDWAENAPRRASRQGRHHRLLLGRGRRLPGRGDQPGHQRRRGVVRVRDTPLRRHAESGGGLRRGQGHQGAIPRALRRRRTRTRSRRTRGSSSRC